MLTGLKGCSRARFLKILPNLVNFNLRIIDRDISTFREEVPDEGDGCRLASIAGICLKCKAQDGNVLLDNPDQLLSRRNCYRKTQTLPVIVLKRVSTTVFENLLFWYSFISTTCLQYAAT